MDESPRIQHLETIIRHQTEIINQQRCHVAELKYYMHQHDLLYEHPWQYFFWRIFVWPFHPDNKRDGGAQ